MKNSHRADPKSLVSAGNGVGKESERPVQTRDAERTYRDIIKVATKEFAQHGLSGGRVDDIAERTRTTKRMIYYYFGSKEALYSAVLAEAYAEIRAIEQELKLETAEPESAIRRLVEFTFDYHEEHTDFIRLVMIENIHEGRFLKKSQKIGSENSAIITVLRDILERGLKSGAFRRQIDPIDLHMLISSFCFFRSSNRHTFGALFHRDFSQPALRKAHKQLIADAIVGLLKQP
jgi:AcrR family transcriptional regulator